MPIWLAVVIMAAAIGGIIFIAGYTREFLSKFIRVATILFMSSIIVLTVIYLIMAISLLSAV